MLDVMFYEIFEEEEELIKRYLPKNLKVDFTENPAKLDDNIKAKIACIRTHSDVNENNFNAIVSRSVGHNHLKKYPIQTKSLPEYCTKAVAQQSIMLTLALLRKLPCQINNFNSFDRSNLTGSEFENKTLTIYGLGKIGYEIYKMAEALGFNVRGVDIVQNWDAKYVSKEEGLNSDIIICCLNLNEHTKNYFDKETLKQTKKGVFFVNVSRGEVSPVEDLIELGNHFNGIALDVFDNESNIDPVKIKESFKINNLILTPHNSFNTYEALENKCKLTVEEINLLLK